MYSSNPLVVQLKEMKDKMDAQQKRLEEAESEQAQMEAAERTSHIVKLQAGRYPPPFFYIVYASIFCYVVCIDVLSIPFRCYLNQQNHHAIDRDQLARELEKLQESLNQQQKAPKAAPQMEFTENPVAGMTLSGTSGFSASPVTVAMPTVPPAYRRQTTTNNLLIYFSVEPTHSHKSGNQDVPSQTCREEKERPLTTNRDRPDCVHLSVE